MYKKRHKLVTKSQIIKTLHVNILGLDQNEWRVDALWVDSLTFNTKNNHINNNVKWSLHISCLSFPVSLKFLRMPHAFVVFCIIAKVHMHRDPNKNTKQNFIWECDDNVTLTIIKGERCWL